MNGDNPHSTPDPGAPYRHPELRPQPTKTPAPYVPDPKLDRIEGFEDVKKGVAFWGWGWRINLHKMTPDAALPLVPEHLQEYRLQALRGEV